MTTETMRYTERARSPGGPAAEVERLEASLPRRSRLREVWVGAFVVAGIFAALAALFLLTDAAVFRGRYFVTAVVDDAGGIRKGDPVRMRGVNIGRVYRFDMVPAGVAIQLEIEGDYGIPEGSHMELTSGGLLGGMVADVVPAPSEALVESGDTLPAVSAGGLMDVASNIGDRADTVLERAEALLSTETVAAVNDGALELQALLAESSTLVSEQRAQLSALVASLRRSAAGLESAAAGGPDIARAAARIEALTTSLDATALSLGRASEALDTVLSRMARGEGTLGRLSTDESLYLNLTAAADQIARLARDIRENPKRYIDLGIF